MDVLELLKKCGIKERVNYKGEILTYCMFHNNNHKTPSLSINVDRRVFVCYACGSKGHIRRILYHHGLINGYWETDINYDDLVSQFSDFTLEEAEINKADEGELNGYRFLHPYLLERGFTKEIILKNKIGFDKQTLRVTIPIWYKDQYYGCIKRTVVDDIPKYLYPENLQKSAIVYAPKPIEIKSQDYLFVVEGSLDALRIAQFGYLSLSVLGCKPSKTQLREIESFKGEVILAFDNDDPGIAGLNDTVKELRKMEISVFSYPERIKDIGSMNEQQFLSGFTKRYDIWSQMFA